ncbi:MAG: hypothetical protein WEA09_05320 [Gemmatimonadota bacterium]
MTDNHTTPTHARDAGGAPPFSHIRNPRKRAFLTAFAATGNRRLASEAAGIHPSTQYGPGWLRDGEFQHALELARQTAAQLLEDEALRRALHGVRRYRFHARTGEPLLHPDECECGHYRRLHIADASGRLRCSVPRCVSCSGFVGVPYVEHEFSDVLLSLLLKAHSPARFGDRLDLRGTLAKIDVSKLPNEALRRIRDGEHPLQVLASLSTAIGSPIGILDKRASLPASSGPDREGGDQ